MQHKKFEYHLIESDGMRKWWWEYDAESNRYWNNNGGFFDKNMLRGEIFEKCFVDDFLELDFTKTYLNEQRNDNYSGWLDRNGKYYPCNYESHDLYATYILKERVRDLEKNGWIRLWGLDRDNDNNVGYSFQYNMTAEQRNWLSKHGYRMEDSCIIILDI